MEQMPEKDKHRLYWCKASFKCANMTSSLLQTNKSETQKQEDCEEKNETYKDGNELRKRICDDFLGKTNYHDTISTLPKSTFRTKRIQSKNTKAQLSLFSHYFQFFLLTTIILSHFLVIHAATTSSKKTGKQIFLIYI